MGYEIIIKKSSGLLIATKVKYDMVNTTSTSSNNIISTSIKIGTSNINIICVYGPQESEKEEERSHFFAELEMEINAATDRTENLAVVGDFNSKLSMSNGKVSSLSSNGTLLNEVLGRYDLQVLNFSEMCKGKWTRVEDKNGNTEMSVIDYMMATEHMVKMTQEIIIDEEKLLAPFWIRKSKHKGTTRQHSDHNVFLVSMEIPNIRSEPSSDKENRLPKGWKISEEGMDRFEMMTENLNGNSISGREENEVKNLIDDMMDSCFRRKKDQRINHPNVNSESVIFIKSLKKIINVILPLMKKGRTERRVGKQYVNTVQKIQTEMFQNQKASRIMETMKELECESGTLSVDKFWKLKKKMSTNDRSKSSILIGDTEIWNGPAIIKEYEKEFTNRLAHKQISKEFSEYEITTRKLLDLYLQKSAKMKSEPDFTYKEIRDAITSLSKGTSPGPHPVPPDVYKRAGRGLINIICKAMNRIKNTLVIPLDWLENLIVTIFKNKGSRKVLKYYRGIFLGDILTKILEKVIKSRIQDKLNNINILQAGSRTNRGPADSLFILNGTIDHAKYLKKRLYITFYDYTTCFDSLWLDDCMISLWDIGIRNELLNLIFKLNETTKIQIKTPFGISDPFVCNRIVKQGSVLSSNLCSASTGELCDQNTKGYATIGSTMINDTLYVDDTTDLNSDMVEAAESHNYIVNFSKAKRLGLNHPKCGTIIINKKTHDSMPRLTIDNDVLKQISSTKFLGDMVNEKGDNKDLIADRVKKGKSVIVNCMALCNEITMGAHHVKVALTLYHSVFVSTLLFNCQAWTNLLKDDMKKLETIQLKYLKRILRAPQSTSNCFVYLELGILPISYIIHIRQLSFLHHILLLQQNDPVRRIYTEQLSLPYEKNWGNQTQQLLKTHNLQNIDPTTMSGDTWKKKVKTVITDHAFAKLKEEAKQKTKTKHLEYSKFAPQPYITGLHPKPASTIFKVRSKNIECKINRKSNSTDTSCRLCQAEEETQDHIVNCPVTNKSNLQFDLQPVMRPDEDFQSSYVTELCRRICSFHDEVSTINAQDADAGKN